ncbi:dNTP triphosphohydrolase, broad substrate specificity [hydrothermal vent metagenome]|uniref:DNTP triphosphohydrolase, broad substrate specificity n=1 Tax=hydrothermal vent metagenome TaxID=652676 RepID=A0A3B0VH34_9ZZZZ
MIRRSDELDKLLAPYAVKSGLSRGRRYKEDEHPFRSVFQRDRDRIIHSHGFRRLEYKTQVFVYHEGDHYRTRLTHTLEVSQISRTIARALGLNEDLAEAIALAHDLGHPPFGHVGEQTLDALLKDKGGFEHNEHSLKVVEVLEKRYPAFDGLNLSFEVREGIIKHNSEHDRPGAVEEYGADMPSLEAQIVDVADEIAYNNHDIDDGLSSRMIEPEQLLEVELWRENFERISRELKGYDYKIQKYQTIRQLINIQATDLVENISSTILDEGISSVEEVRARSGPLARFSPRMQAGNVKLKIFLMDNLYNHYRVLRMASKARKIITELFNIYTNDLRLLPPHFAGQADRVGKERLVCDYIAGMTDRYALDEYTRLLDPHVKV